MAEQFSWVPLPNCSPPGCPFPNKIPCFVSTCVSSDNSFPSVRQEPSFGPWKGVSLPATKWFYIELSEELPSHFPQWLHHFTVPPALHKGFNFSSSSTTSVIFHFFDNSHPSRCEDVSHCGFDLHVLIGHLFIFFGEMSTKVPGPFFYLIKLFVFLLLRCRSSSYSLDINPFLGFMCVAFFFSPDSVLWYAKVLHQLYFLKKTQVKILEGRQTV